MALRKTSGPLRGIYYTLAVSLLGAFAFITMRGPQVIPALFTTWDEIRAMERNNAELKREVDMRRDRVEQLKKDPEAMELEFRRLLEMQKKGEVDFKLQTAPPKKDKQ